MRTCLSGVQLEISCRMSMGLLLTTSGWSSPSTRRYMRRKSMQGTVRVPSMSNTIPFNGGFITAAPLPVVAIARSPRGTTARVKLDHINSLLTNIKYSQLCHKFQSVQCNSLTLQARVRSNSNNGKFLERRATIT